MKNHLTDLFFVILIALLVVPAANGKTIGPAMQRALRSQACWRNLNDEAEVVWQHTHYVKDAHLEAYKSDLEKHRYAGDDEYHAIMKIARTRCK